MMTHSLVKKFWRSSGMYPSSFSYRQIEESSAVTSALALTGSRPPCPAERRWSSFRYLQTQLLALKTGYCHSDPPSECQGRRNRLPPTVIEFQVFYEPQNSYWYSGRHRRRGTKIHPDAGAPSLVRSRLAGRFRPFRRKGLFRGRALAPQDPDSARCRQDDGFPGHSRRRAEDYLRRPRRLHRSEERRVGKECRSRWS